MDSHFLQNIQYKPSARFLLQQACLEPGSEEAAMFLSLAEDLAACAHPKAYGIKAAVNQSLPPPAIEIGGVAFSSPILCTQLATVTTVYPYLATCGMESCNAVMSISEPFKRFWGELILEDILATAKRELDTFVKTAFPPATTASLSPGSLPEWPLSQQAALFTLLADGPRQCGVTLTSTFLMIPTKSVSGIIFPTTHLIPSCEFCARAGQCTHAQKYNAAAFNRMNESIRQ